MQWEKPEFVEISLACEIGSYANAELPAAISAVPSDGTRSTQN